MLEVKMYDQEKNTWNVVINNKPHVITIDVWWDLYVDGERLGPFREFIQASPGTTRAKHVFKVDGVKVEHMYYPWEDRSKVKAHLFVDGRDLVTGEREITYVESRTPIMPQILGFVLAVNSALPWGFKLGIVIRILGLVMISLISQFAVKTKYSDTVRVLGELGMFVLFFFIEWLLFKNGAIFLITKTGVHGYELFQ